MTRPNATRYDGGAASLLTTILAALGPFVLYLRTVAPTVYGVDSAELATGAYLLGIVHPPGSPGYLLLGHTFTWLPFGDVGYRLNLFSAFSCALSLSLLALIVLRLTGDRLVAVATSWFVGSTYYVWVTAVATEVYALHGCILLGLIALALRWRAERETRVFYALCLLAGFGLGIHLSLALLLPGLAVLAMTSVGASRARPGLLARGALCGLLGLSVYAYLPLRHLADLPLNPARDYWHVDLTSWAGFSWMVSGQGFERHFFAVPWHVLPEQMASFAYRLWSNFMGLGALLGMVGLFFDFRAHPWLHLSLLLMLCGHLFFYLPYGAGDQEMMFSPVYLIWGLWIGLGAHALCRRFAPASRLGAATLFAMAAFAVVLNFRLLDVSDDWSARQRGESLLRSLPPDAVFVGTWGDLRLIEYLQVVEKQRGDVRLLDLAFSDPEGRPDLIATEVRRGRPVFVGRCPASPPAGLRCDYVEACDCYRVRADTGSAG